MGAEKAEDHVTVLRTVGKRGATQGTKASQHLAHQVSASCLSMH